MSNRRWFSWSVLLMFGLTTSAIWAIVRSSSAVDTVVDGNPFTGPEVEVCGPEIPMDPVGIGGGRGGPSVPFIDGDILTVGVGYACGCATHHFGGCWSGEFSGSAPVETDLDVAHDDGGEGCELSCHSTIAIDLTPIADVYQEVYGPGPGTVLIHLRSYGLEYVFPGAVPVEETTWARIKASFR